MTPREFDPRSVQAKLELLSDLLDDLDDLGPVDAHRLETDRFTRHVVERILTQLVDIAAGASAHVAAALGPRAPSDYRQSFELAAAAGALDTDLAADLAGAVGLRNLLTHEYGRIDHARVAEATPLARDRFGEYVRQVSRFLQDHQDDTSRGAGGGA